VFPSCGLRLLEVLDESLANVVQIETAATFSHRQVSHKKGLLGHG